MVQTFSQNEWNIQNACNLCQYPHKYVKCYLLNSVENSVTSKFCKYPKKVRYAGKYKFFSLPPVQCTIW